MSAGASAAFPNYLQMRARIPMPIWHALRVASVAAALALCGLLFVAPASGLFIFWGAVVPSLPLVFFLAPGLWRNVCPMAALNQTPRLLGVTRGLALPQWLKEYGYVIGIALFFAIVPARKALFNSSPTALALLLLGALAAAFVGGLIFKGKSGWCGSVCPLLPVQRVYGQTPFLTVRNGHCAPCVGCTKNCYDFNPRAAYLADLHDDDPHYRGYRTFFVGAFPGLVLGFYLTPSPPDVSVLEMYLRIGAFVLASLGSFTALESFARTTTNRLTALYGAAALNSYYWFNFPTLAATIGVLTGLTPPLPAVWLARAALLGLSALWVWRTVAKEPLFLLRGAAEPVRVPRDRAEALRRATRSDEPEVTFLPENRRVGARAGCTVLEVIEANGLPIESGCRMGMCGADPVAIVAGMENLAAAGEDERTTLRRLGLAENTRLACCARIQGSVSVGLTPERADALVAPAPLDFDRAIKRVVILGNGVAGVTAADHVRRRHPECEIDLIGREPHHLYNRMAITRLIYGRSAMAGLYLLPDGWYDEHRITCWLNTRVTAIDCRARTVELGTGESLAYDRLIVATGSSGQVPPIDGVGLAGSFVLRTAADAMQIRGFVQERGCRQAVVAGGGLLGLEAAYALKKLGLRVSVLERSDVVLRRQLDRRASELLTSYLAGLGIDIVSRADAEAVEGDDRVRTVRLKDGRELPCDVFLVCAGIVPNVELARAAGLRVDRGVVVDDQMRTSAPDVFAAGDVAESRGLVTGLWPTAVEQAEVAAVNALGGARSCAEIVPTTILKVAGVDLTSIGRVEPADGEIAIALEDAGEHRYRKLIVARGRVVGAIMLGYPREAPLVAAAIKGGLDVAAQLDRLRAGDWSALGSGEAALAAAPAPHGRQHAQASPELVGAPG